MSQTTVLHGGQVIDPAQNLNKFTDLVITDGKIAAIGDEQIDESAEVIDVSGLIVTPGWVDLHVHAYGELGFAYPDYIGIYQGVTTFCEAGGPGFGTFPEFKALMTDSTITDLYCGLYVRPMGIVSSAYIEGNVRTLGSWDVGAWLDIVNENRDVLKYLKLGAFGEHDMGPLRMGKGVAEILGLPTYTHIGEFQVSPTRDTTGPAFEVAERDDMITHIFHGNPGTVLDDAGKVRPEVIAAEKRGVLFDIGMGSTNFSFDIAEKAIAQGLVPHTISSDLQQFNVLGPVHSFANVMTCFLALGFSIEQIIERITIAPARALSIDDHAGSLAIGMPADVSIMKIEDGDFVLDDCMQQTRNIDRQIVPVMAFKRGVRYDCDVTLARDERNWLPMIDEDVIPQRAETLEATQLSFLHALALELKELSWDETKVDLNAATKVQESFHAIQSKLGLPLADALTATYKCFLEEPFTYQIGLFLTRLEHDFALNRLQQVGGGSRVAA
jgi:dihydroorotase